MKQNQTFYGIDPTGDDFREIVDTAIHVVGGRANFERILKGCAPGSRTLLSDTVAMTLALGQSAMDLGKPQFTLLLVQTFMGIHGYQKDQFSTEEVRDIEVLLLSAVMECSPLIASTIGITPELINKFKQATSGNISGASNGTENL